MSDYLMSIIIFFFFSSHRGLRKIHVSQNETINFNRADEIETLLEDFNYKFKCLKHKNSFVFEPEIELHYR